MRLLLKLEELLMLALGIYLYSLLPFPWWWFPALFLLPDIGMLGYLRGPVTGAWLYNLFHHKGLAVLIYLAGTRHSLPLWQLTGIILFSHASFDRVFGYGLKYPLGFAYTHLGDLNKKKGWPSVRLKSGYPGDTFGTLYLRTKRCLRGYPEPHDEALIIWYR